MYGNGARRGESTGRGEWKGGEREMLLKKEFMTGSTEQRQQKDTIIKEIYICRAVCKEESEASSLLATKIPQRNVWTKLFAATGGSSGASRTGFGVTS